MGEHDRDDLAARAAGPARATPPPATTSTTARAATRYDVRGRVGARVDLQRQRRPLPLPEHAAGLLAVQHLDPRPGLGRCSASRSSSSSWRRCADGELAAVRRHEGGRSRYDAARARRPRDFYIAHTADRRHPVLGHRRARARATWATTSTGPPTRSTTTSRSTAPPPRSPRRACSGSAATSAAADRAAPARGTGRRAHRRADAVRRAVPVDGPAAPGAAPALGLPPAERLGPRARPAHAVRRVVHVGRLPPARTRAHLRRLARDEPYYAFFLR